MSFLGYGKIYPNSNVNSHVVNIGNTHNPRSFGSNEIPGQNGLPGLSGAKNNVDAANSCVSGLCFQKGGARILKRKIKNITKRYKSMGKRGMKSRKNRLTKMNRRKGTMRKRTTRRRKSQRGGWFSNHTPFPAGYSQYQNNLPNTPTFSVGGKLSSQDLGLANPPPIQKLSNDANCADNYNHYTGKGFASRGH
jgi:hypothetical protein